MKNEKEISISSQPSSGTGGDSPVVVIERRIKDEQTFPDNGYCKPGFTLKSSGLSSRRRLGKGPSFVIMGGKLVNANEYPFAVHLDNNGAFCSGVLISKHYVLTVAHCIVTLENIKQRNQICKGGHIKPERNGKIFIEPQSLKIYPGSRCPKPEFCKPKRTVYKSISAYPHPEFNLCNLENDIALIELEGDVSEEDGAPICLPEKDEKLSGTLSTVGYGYDPMAKDPLVPALQVVRFKKYSEKNGVIITIDPRRDSCKGDSGGPLFKNKNGLLTLKEEATTLTCENTLIGFVKIQMFAITSVTIDPDPKNTRITMKPRTREAAMVD
ncbi:trypsin [Necator americanus]|uniref:Trypsin n=1 Tax=Necator americanus TaxID=51031 RepID=W2TKA6_NECAM|nr:trypsin [Necator americanus]ETN81606.1 trypsin [Necator americanus]